MATTETARSRIAGWFGGRLPRKGGEGRSHYGTHSWRRLTRWLSRRMPKRLYARSLIIVIAPIVLLQSVVAFVFMERHWQTVTQRLSTAVVRDIAGIIDVIDTYPQDPNYDNIIRIAQQRLQLNIAILPPDPLPPPGPKPFFSILDRALSREITKQINRPFWIDTVGNSNIVEIRIKLKHHVLQGLRQAQPGLCLQHADLPVVDGGHVARPADHRDPLPAQPDPPDPATRRGRRELRQRAADAARFPAARRRGGPPRRHRLHPDARAHRAADGAAHRHADRGQPRPAHDPHALQAAACTRRRQKEVEALDSDIADMQSMLEGYLAFARGEASEESGLFDLQPFLEKLKAEATLRKRKLKSVAVRDRAEVVVRPNAFARLVSNLVSQRLPPRQQRRSHRRSPRQAG